MLFKPTEAETQEDDLQENNPYVLEDFGVLELQEKVTIARTANASKHSTYMQIFTIDSSDSSHVKLTVYKVKRSYQSRQQILNEKLNQEKEKLKK